MTPPTAPVSVIIPCYNCAQTITRAVESVFNQSLRPAEVLLINDASSDNTREVLRQLAARFSPVITVSELPANSGPSAARNSGWKIATQPYIVFLDADDSWHSEKLRTQYEYMKSNPDVVLCGHQCVWLREGEASPPLPGSLVVAEISAGSLLFKNAFSTPTAMLKRDVSFRFQVGKHCAEDLLLWQQIAFAGLRVMRMESPLAYVHKPLYGGSGLSAELWNMEKGELSNFVVLFRAGSIGFLIGLAALFFSIAKFIRRLILIKVMGKFL